VEGKNNCQQAKIAKESKLKARAKQQPEPRVFTEILSEGERYCRENASQEVR
jgi:hypothetical protein